MKKFGLTLVIAAIFAVIPSFNAAAQFHWGPKVGVAINSLHFSADDLDSDNRAGFTGGLMCEFTAPVLGIGFDASVMYVRRDLKAEKADGSDLVRHRDYIEIPVNFKYKIGIPAIGKILTPFVTTGPSVSFLTSRKSINAALKNKEVDAAWNFGFGVQLFNKVQVAASYGLGLSKSITEKAGFEQVDIDGKTRCWTVTAAYIF